MHHLGAPCRGNAEVCLGPSPRHSGARLLARARNPYSRSWLWIPGLRLAHPGMTTGLLFDN